MKNEHTALLKEITDEAELITISDGAGSGQWETGASGVWAGIMGGGEVSGKRSGTEFLEENVF
ncbi:hypothetical protein [Cedecea colo]|uniref:Uncharacterized protein n=1 Tax=Cedecea colo TaxID=2552946 RepID=A0ABX0VQN6_9ENTR|nr:hypothetical protein [Cedecea colo]NIY49262.1 hypothetical protein [Cedecea colo]